MEQPEVSGYRIEATLGGGGFGTVYQAVHELLDQRVALKVLHATAKAETGWRERFLAEARSTAALRGHPHVVIVYDAGFTTGDDPYIAMELLTGGSFGDHVRLRGPLGPLEGARVGSQVADALQAATSLGIIHRDVKPDNVLIGQRGEAKLADFGIALVSGATRLTETGAMFASGSYTAPEVYRGEPSTAAADIFSLGATVHTLIDGSPPFVSAEGNPYALMHAVTSAEPRPLPASTPTGLVELVGRMLSKRPEDRPTAAESASALAEVITMMDTPERPTDSTVPLVHPRVAPAPDQSTIATPAIDDAFDAATPVPPRGRRRSKVLVGLGLVGMLVGATVGAWALFGLRESSDTRDESDNTAVEAENSGVEAESAAEGAECGRWATSLPSDDFLPVPPADAYVEGMGVSVNHDGETVSLEMNGAASIIYVTVVSDVPLGITEANATGVSGSDASIEERETETGFTTDIRVSGEGTVTFAPPCTAEVVTVGSPALE